MHVERRVPLLCSGSSCVAKRSSSKSKDEPHSEHQQCGSHSCALHVFGDALDLAQSGFEMLRITES